MIVQILLFFGRKSPESGANGITDTFINSGTIDKNSQARLISSALESSSALTTQLIPVFLIIPCVSYSQCSAALRNQKNPAFLKNPDTNSRRLKPFVEPPATNS